MMPQKRLRLLGLAASPPAYPAAIRIRFERPAPPPGTLVGEKGETFYVTTTLRAYNATLDRWELVGMDRGNGLQDVGTAERVGGEVRIEQKFGVMSGDPVVRRIRYYDIAPARFVLLCRTRDS